MPSMGVSHRIPVSPHTATAPPRQPKLVSSCIGARYQEVLIESACSADRYAGEPERSPEGRPGGAIERARHQEHHGGRSCPALGDGAGRKPVPHPAGAPLTRISSPELASHSIYFPCCGIEFLGDYRLRRRSRALTPSRMDSRSLLRPDIRLLN